MIEFNKLFPLLLQIRFSQLVSKVDKEKLDLSFLCPPPTFSKYFSQWPSSLLVQTLEWSCHYLNDTICNAKGHCIHLLHYLPGTFSQNSIVCNLTFFQDIIWYFPQTGTFSHFTPSVLPNISIKSFPINVFSLAPTLHTPMNYKYHLLYIWIGVSYILFPKNPLLAFVMVWKVHFLQIKQILNYPPPLLPQLENLKSNSNSSDPDGSKCWIYREITFRTSSSILIHLTFCSDRENPSKSWMMSVFSGSKSVICGSYFYLATQIFLSSTSILYWNHILGFH